MHESRVTAEKAGVQEAELRVKQAQRRLAYGEFPLVPQDGRMAEMEQRLGSLEKTLDMLQQEVGSLKRMIRYRWKDPIRPTRLRSGPLPSGDQECVGRGDLKAGQSGGLPMISDVNQVIVTTDDYPLHSVRNVSVHHRDFPELRGKGGSPEDAATPWPNC